MMSSEIRVYVSATQRDMRFRDELVSALVRAGAHVSHRDRAPVMADAIAACEVFVLVYATDDAVEPAMRQECELAYALYAREPGRRLIPVMAPRAEGKSSDAAIRQVLRQLGLEQATSAVHSTGGSARGHAKRNGVSVSQRTLTRARSYFEDLLHEEPADEVAWHGLGDILALLSDNTSAVSAYEEALKLCPDDSVVWCDAGTAYMRLSRYDDALRAFDKALELSPASARAIDQRGRALLALGRPEEALTMYEGLLLSDESSPWLWHAHGLSLLALGRADESVGSFRRAVQILPEFSVAWRDMAGALRATGHWAEAETARQKAER
jgi:tetratricopeptide (TPR) repeat protein